MSLSYSYEYFKNMKHIKDLQKLKDDKLYPIIQELYKEIEKLNNNKTTKLKDLKNLCDETTEIINIIKNILISYKCVYYEEMNTQNNKKRENINDTLYEIEFIEQILKDLKNLKINSKKLKNLTDDLLLFIRMLCGTINEIRQ